MADGTAPDIIVRRRDALHVRAIREADRECDFIASTETVDSYNEIVDQASWDLTRFDKNPVILYQHDRWSLPIGQATRCKVVKGQLEVTIKFASAEANPEAEKVWLLVQERVLRAVSVGFKPFDGKYEMRDGHDVYVLYNCELREISVVTVPANEDCLAQMKAASLAELGVCTIAPGREAEMMAINAKDPEMRERIRSAITTRDAAASATNITPAASAGGLNTPDPATKDKRTMLTEAEIKALQESTALAVATAQLAEKAANDKAAAADIRAKAIETERDTRDATIATLTSEHTKAATDRDAAIARAEKAEAAHIEIEVEALVGKKIAPTEKDDFIKLRTESPALFTSMVAKRADMKLLDPVISAKGDAVPPPLNGAPNGEKAVATWNKL